MEEKKLALVMLFDFFGDLLTEKQREYFDLYYNEDLSLAEIAENEGISRQGVRDILRRSETILRQTEEKTGIVARFLWMQEQLSALQAETLALAEQLTGDRAETARRIARELDRMKGWVTDGL